MFTVDECLRIWTDEPLVQTKESNTHHTSLPDKAKDFLTNIGLPRQYDCFSFSELESNLVKVRDYHIAGVGDSHIPIESHLSDFIVIGKITREAENFVWIPAIICIDPRYGTVVLCNRDGEEALMNSDIWSVFQFLSVLKSEWRAFDGDSHAINRIDAKTEFLKKLARHIEEIMVGIDPMAMADEDNFWPEVIIEIESTGGW